jgi:ubiquinone/menaquinone biosynthesis C-methylase UbiE
MPASRFPKSLRTDWGSVADWYDQLVGPDGSEYHQRVVLPGTLKLLRLQPSESFLDIACGQGVLCRLAQQQQASVTGIDAAARLIDAARQHGPPNIRYEVADAARLDFLGESSFDAAACVLAIQNIHPLAPVFDAVARLLKYRGRFVLVMMHPAFRGPKETAWGWDEKTKTQYRRVDRYLLPRKAPIVTHPGQKTGQYTWSFHKPLEAYVKALARAGLLIDALEEWTSHKTSDPGPRAAAENTARQEIPMFLAIRALKACP